MPSNNIGVKRVRQENKDFYVADATNIFNGVGGSGKIEPNTSDHSLIHAQEQSGATKLKG